jgi:enoyl-CoA hydratase/carnithine racemase
VPLPDQLEFTLSRDGGAVFLTLVSEDGMNRLTRRKVLALNEEIRSMASAGAPALPLVISGKRNFSVGADLNEVRVLSEADALEFAGLGQSLMNAIAAYPAPVIAAIQGHCMGGGLDLALACRRRIAAPHAVFGHRGAALGLITGWGGTQRLPRLIGKGRALELFVAAEKITAARAVQIGLVEALASDPEAEAVRLLAALGTQRVSGENARL